MHNILIDSSAAIAFFIQTEHYHFTARQFAVSHPTVRWTVLSTVFDETVTWIRAKGAIQGSIDVGRVLRMEHHYINLSDADDAATWDAFKKYDDKRWSYTDCSILVMAQRLQIWQVFTFDEHIRQMAGLGIMAVP